MKDGSRAKVGLRKRWGLEVKEEGRRYGEEGSNGDKFEGEEKRETSPFSTKTTVSMSMGMS